MNNTSILNNEKQEDFIIGDAVVYQYKSNQINNGILYIEAINSDQTIKMYNSITGHLDKVSIQEIRLATISELKNKKRDVSALVQFIGDVDLHYQRALYAQSEVS